MNRFSILLLGAACLAPHVLAAEKPVEDLLSKMRKAYQAVSGATLQVHVKIDNQQGVRSGIVNVDYSRPNLIRYRSEIGGAEIRRYSNGKNVVTFRGVTGSNENKVNVDTLGGQVPGNLEWLCFFDWKRQLSTTPGANMAQSKFKLVSGEKWNNKSWIVLEEKAEQLNVMVRYFIDPKTFFIWRCDVHLLNGDKKRVVQTEVQRLALGVRHPASIFEPPAAASPAKPKKP